MKLHTLVCGLLAVALMLSVPFSAQAATSYTWTEQTSSGVGNWSAVTVSTDGTKMAAVRWGEYIYTSTNGGVTWVQRTNAGSKRWNGIAGSSDGTKLVAVEEGSSSNGSIYTSTDSGATWTERTGAGAREWNWVASSADGTKLVAVAYNGQIYTSTDSGANWTARDSTRNWSGVTSSADGTKLAASVNVSGQLYISTTSGATWTAASGTSGVDWWGIASSADGATIAAISTAGPVYVSTDSGASWTSRTPDGTATWYGVTVSGDGSKIAVGGSKMMGGFKIFVSEDNGSSWTEQTDAGTKSWRSLGSSNDGSVLAAGTWGGGNYVWTAQAVVASSGGGNNNYARTKPVAASMRLIQRDSITVDVGSSESSNGITAVGFEYKASDDTIRRSFPVTGLSSFKTRLDDLTCDTRYTFRSFATNALGTTYGDWETIETAACESSSRTQRAGSGRVRAAPDPVTEVVVPVASSTYAFTRDLYRMTSGEDVRKLQEFLNTHGFPVASSGDGSSGKETEHFGPATQTALAAFQNAQGITPALGYFGALTRARIAEM